MTPHIFEHLTETERCFAEAMVEPVTVQEAADRAAVTLEYARGRLTQSTKDHLHIDAGWHWRVALTRMYYGIDPCWCRNRSDVHMLSTDMPTLATKCGG